MKSDTDERNIAKWSDTRESRPSPANRPTLHTTRREFQTLTRYNCRIKYVNFSGFAAIRLSLIVTKNHARIHNQKSCTDSHAVALDNGVLDDGDNRLDSVADGPVSGVESSIEDEIVLTGGEVLDEQPPSTAVGEGIRSHSAAKK